MMRVEILVGEFAQAGLRYLRADDVEELAGRVAERAVCGDERDGLVEVGEHDRLLRIALLRWRGPRRPLGPPRRLLDHLGERLLKRRRSGALPSEVSGMNGVVTAISSAKPVRPGREKAC